jgi:DNA-binding NarL/FixJ family response regulator
MGNQSGSVVVVDVDDACRKFLISVLQQAGYAAVGFASAEEALVSIASERPDVVLTEVRLPGVSGYELCRQLRDVYRDRVALIIISGDRAEPFDRAAGIFLGADDYLVKPVDAGELLARVWRLVSRSNGADHSPSNGRSNAIRRLSDRERQVLDLLATGATQEDIAQRLFISPKTVATHIQRVLTKLGVHSRTQAVALALRQDRDVTGHRHGVKVAE